MEPWYVVMFLTYTTPLANQVHLEIFLPSYIDCDYVPLENRRDPVHEITLSDEESKSLLPQ